MPIYRNQTSAISQIQAMSRIRITTPQEAVAFLRALAPLHEQVAYVLQRSSIRSQQNANRIDNTVREMNRRAAAATPVSPVPDPTTTFEPEDLKTEEGFTESDIEEKVAKLKKARKSSK